MERHLGKVIELSNEMRELYVNYDFRYFLQKHLKTEDDFQKIKGDFERYRNELLSDLKTNKKQFLHQIDGSVRKMHSGGLLPSLFQLDETRKLTIFPESEIAKDWASFEIWKKYEKRKILKKKISKMIIFIGSILAYILTVLKLIEYFKN
jgi:hypothetical protein